jgi:hypothetical protein
MGYLMFTLEEGRIAIKIARSNIERKLGNREIDIPKAPDVFKQDYGVFVTLNRYPGKDLRGCIGYAEPIMPLKKALLDVSLSAALRDPRFPAVKLEEMDRIVIDVTLRTPPEDINYNSPEELISQIKIGRDGLIARSSFFSGLLLPQVPVEWGWNVEEFLSHTCQKAGLSMNEWRSGKVNFQKFSGMVFGEKEPRGEVVEIELA